MTKVTDNVEDKQIGSSHIHHNQHTLGHHACPACELQKATLLRSISADTTIEDATDIFIELKTVDAIPGAITARYVSPHSMRMYHADKKALELFFKGMKLKDIHWYNMRSYQQLRLAGADPFIRYRRPQDAKPKIKRGEVVQPAKGKIPCPAKPQQINRELGFLRMLKQRAGCWTDEDKTYYQRLQNHHDEIQRALSPNEHRLWLDVSRQQERWTVVFHWSVVAFDACLSTNEIRGLRIGDVNLHHRLITVPRAAAKNRARHRTIPIENADCLWSLERLLARAHDLGAREPQHYLFPFHKGQQVYDPERHMTESGIKKIWEEVREATGLKWFRMYDARHTGATRLAEAGVPPEIIKKRLGHCTQKMYEHYTHIFEDVQRQWLRPRAYTQHMYAPPPAPWPEQRYDASSRANDHYFFRRA